MKLLGDVPYSAWERVTAKEVMAAREREEAAPPEVSSVGWGWLAPVKRYVIHRGTAGQQSRPVARLMREEEKVP